MDESMILTLGGEAIKTALSIAGPMLIAAMSVGIIVSVLQAVTQINEATLSFIPKILAVVFVLIVMAPWMLKVIYDYAALMIGSGHEFIR